MGGLNFFNKKSKLLKEEELDDFTKEMHGEAIYLIKKIEKEYTGLDFSIKSLSVIENFLEQTSKFYNKIGKDQLEAITNKTGCYILEVARQNFGGKYYWYDKLNQPILVTGQPEFEMSLLAVEKVKARLKNGIENNIVFFFEGYINGVKDKKSQMIV